MNNCRLGALKALLLSLVMIFSATAGFAAERPAPQEVVQTWYKLVLELVRHTSNYSPPVASRSFAYLGVTAYQSVAGEGTGLKSLVGQLNGLTALPEREKGAVYDDAVVLNAALSVSMKQLFDRTGPTGQHVFGKLSKKMHADVSDGLPQDVVDRSAAYGEKVALAVLEWSKSDGGAVVENMGFPLEYALSKEPGHWVPTSLIRQQQMPLLPEWGKNRTFAMPGGASCGLPDPPAFSEDKNSAFYKEADEVYRAVKDITPEHKTIARFWSDDPMLSPTPPGHWISIAMEVLEKEHADLPKTVDAMARLGIVLADSFIGCWDAKFKFDLIRPITYIRKTMDPKWDALLITPPFPEYPSGHSTQSGAAAGVLAELFGKDYAFDDHTHEKDGLGVRHFKSFREAAEEAAISRLYGGIHFRSAIMNGLDQGDCIAAYTNALKTR